MLGQYSEIEDEDSFMETIGLSIRTYLPPADRRQPYRNSFHWIINYGAVPAYPVVLIIDQVSSLNSKDYFF